MLLLRQTESAELWIWNTVLYVLGLLSSVVYGSVRFEKHFLRSSTQNYICDTGSLIDNGSTASVLGCSSKCALDDRCSSFYFRRGDRSCSGSSLVHTDFSGCNLVQDTVYYTALSEESNQWAVSVVSFSSEYSATSYSANQTLGSPNVYPAYGDNELSWAPKVIDANQFIEVAFSTAVYITRVDVYETDHGGAVTRISARDGGGQLHVLWGPQAATVIKVARIFSPSFTKTSFKSAVVRLDVDQSVSNTWIEIDAVQIAGTAN